MDFDHKKNLHFIGLKGSGVCALALLLKNLKYSISGSDSADTFYTDALLAEAGIKCKIGFKKENIAPNTDLVIYSAAYTIANNQELAYAKLHFPTLSYPEALGALSKKQSSTAVVGTHGKTSTTALTGTLIRAYKLPAMVLTGGRVVDWDNNTIWYGGKKAFIAEVCEYRNHFLNFSAQTAIFTNAEWDHPDFFKNEQEVFDSFRNFLQSLQPPQKIIACLDDPGVQKSMSKELEPNLISYGQAPVLKDRSINLTDLESELSSKDDLVLQRFNHKNLDIMYTLLPEEKGLQKFSISGLDIKADTLEWQLCIPGKALVANSVAALIYLRELHKQFGIDPHTIDWQRARDSLKNFKGISRRTEVLYNDKNIIVLDDYAHHPTAIAMILEGIKNFYRPNRLIVDFMPHTYTRTAALLEDFSRAFSAADILIINSIYASAREKELYELSVSKGSLPLIDARRFVESIKKYHARVDYMPKFSDVSKWAFKNLQEGDLFVSLGAGDNFRISQELTHLLQKKYKKK